MFFLLVGLAVDTVYLGVFWLHGLPVPLATIATLLFSILMTVTANNFGGHLILTSVGAEKLDIQIPEHRELHNVVTEMALASGCSMPKVYVVYDPAPNAFATGREEKSAAVVRYHGTFDSAQP